jgi:hypothetical protein
MTITMANIGEKSGVETPTYIVTASGNEMSGGQKPRGVQKKHILIAISAVVIVGLVIAAILVGMYMFSEANKEIVKFSLQFKSTSDDQKTNQDVVSDPNDNVVSYHVTKPGQDVNVVNDFNKDIQVVKIETAEGTNCYISALNRSQASDPSQITGAASMTGSGGVSTQTFSISGTPVSDTSFLPKKARDMCKGVSVYWAYRHCPQQGPDDHNMTKSTSGVVDRSKRTLYDAGRYNNLYCVGGCCKIVCACYVRFTETVDANGVHNCQVYYQYGTCCSISSYCQNVYMFNWKTPGLNCP